MSKAPAGISPQLALNIRSDREVGLADFVAGTNGAALAAVEALVSGRALQPVYLYGDAATGKSHLLKAACRAVSSAGGRAAYLPLATLRQYVPEVVEGMESAQLVVVDELEAIADALTWQEAVFHLYNRVRDGGGAFLAAGRHHPDQLGFALPDLVSRLRWGLVFRLTELEDADKKRALQARAEIRGLALSEEVLDYLLQHYRRDAAYLFDTLDRLDDASLRAKRRLTVPFVRRVLRESPL